jgi:hypothetical protein
MLRVSRVIPAWLVFAVAVLGACVAESTGPDEPADTGSDDTEPDDEDEESGGRDLGLDDDGSSDEPDSDSDSDSDEDLDDVSDGEGSDSGAADDGGSTDALPNGCDSLAGECDPFTTVCNADGVSLTACGRCGMVLTIETCEEDEVCDDADGTAECRPCAGDECQIDPVCTPGEPVCQDFRTQALCNADGQPSGGQPCPEGRRCIEGGICGPAGQTTGASCTTNVNNLTGCTGQYCVCGSEYVTANGTTGCTAELASGYCATADCGFTGCDPAREICADFGGTGRFGNGSFCMLNGGCTTTGRPCGTRPGFICQEFATRDNPGNVRSWDMGCWPDAGLARIGGTCASNAACSGALCLTGTGPSRPTYCSSDCTDNGSCPSNSTCVRDPGNSARFICAANATTADCPRLGEDFAIRAVQAERYDGGRISVCLVP